MQEIEECREFIAERASFRPKIGIVLGTGLGGLVDRIDVQQTIPYESIPHFPVSTVESHTGNFIVGSLGGRELFALQGRFHYYEGYSLKQATFPIRVLKALGVETLIISNAAGGLNPEFSPGDVMAITDHINLTGGNPLIGSNIDSLGPRFPDMTQPYNLNLIRLAEKTAIDEGIPFQKGVYVGISGPSMETPAEIRFLRMIGADAVGMSTVPEVIVAAHSDMKVLGISVISNLHTWDIPRPHSVKQIIEMVKKTGPSITKLVERVVGEIEE